MASYLCHFALENERVLAEMQAGARGQKGKMMERMAISI
jgi:hypothetical protein